MCPVCEVTKENELLYRLLMFGVGKIYGLATDLIITHKMMGSFVEVSTNGYCTPIGTA